MIGLIVSAFALIVFCDSTLMIIKMLENDKEKPKPHF